VAFSLSCCEFCQYQCNWLSRKLVSERTCYVSSGMLDSVSLHLALKGILFLSVIMIWWKTEEMLMSILTVCCRPIVSTCKIQGRTETTAWSGRWRSHVAGINSDYSTHKMKWIVCSVEMVCAAILCIVCLLFCWLLATTDERKFSWLCCPPCWTTWYRCSSPSTTIAATFYESVVSDE